MLRIREITDPAAAKSYYRQSDYYLEVPGDWLGEGSGRLGLQGLARQADFEALCDNINPATGRPLTSMTLDGRRVGWDFNFNSSKSVGIARELVSLFDSREGQRIEDAHREAVAYAMRYVENDMQCRVRDAGKNENRTTGNMIAMRVSHRTTRPNEDDQTPDMELHDHVVVINGTWDPKAGKWKAADIGQIWHDASYYEAIYHNQLAANLQGLGYGIRRSGKGFEIEGISDALIDTYSRRKKAIEKQAAALGIYDDRTKDKLGATTRLSKATSRLVDLLSYWDGKLTSEQRDQIKHLKGQPSYRSDATSATAWAIRHLFERHSVVGTKKLYETAIRHGIGSVTPEQVRAEAHRQGVLFSGDECSTRTVLDQEQRIIGFARDGKGTFTPLAPGKADGLEGLSREQQAAVRHVWESPDQLMLVRGGAGTGKTTMMTPALAKLGTPVVLLAPTADASRGQLRDEGFKEANTVAAFLGNAQMQERVRKGGIIWIDEAGLLPINDLEQVCDLAHQLRARVVLQGDPRQHKAVQRHGNMLNVLHDFAALPVAELKEIKRQKGDYAEAVAAIRDGALARGDAIFRKLGWLVEGEGHDRLVEEYARALEERKADGAKKTVLVIDPTHKDGDALSEKLRAVRKDKGLIGREERSFLRLVAIDLTDAQKADPHSYGGDETIQFFRNSGPFKAGHRVKANALLPLLSKLKPGTFAVYEERTLNLALGDTVRITGGGTDVTGKHRIDNGRLDEIRGFTKEGNPILGNGWALAKDFGHIKHGLVSTSHAAQSKTFDVVLAAMNRASLGAMGAAQGYVTASRGRERGMVFTDLPKEDLLKALAHEDGHTSATELFARRQREHEAVTLRQSLVRFLERMRHAYQDQQRRRRLRQESQGTTQERGTSHAR